MTAIVKFEDGEVVENTIDTLAATPVSDLYEFVKIHKNVAYAGVKALDASGIEDSEAEKWASSLNNVQIQGNDLGYVQAKATDFSLATYRKHCEDAFTAVPTSNPSENEIEALQEGNVLSFYEGNGDVSEPSDIPCPVSPDGKQLPVLVTSNDTSEATHTYEEAMDILNDVLSHIEGADVSQQIDESDPSPATGNSSRSDNPLDPTSIEGLGEKTIERLESNGFTVSHTQDVNLPSVVDADDEMNYYDERQNHIGNNPENETVSAADVLSKLNELEDELSDKMFVMVENVLDTDGPVEAHEFLTDFEESLDE